LHAPRNITRKIESRQVGGAKNLDDKPRHSVSPKASTAGTCWEIWE